MKQAFLILQRLFMVLLLVLVIAIFIRHRQDFIDASQVAERGAWPYLLLALPLELAYQWNRAGLYRFLYSLFGKKPTQIDVLQAQLAALTANVALPAAGLAGLHLYEKRLRRYHIPTGVIIFANTLYVAFDYLSLFAYFLLVLFLLALGLIALEAAVISAGLIVVAIFLILGGAVVLTVLHLGQIYHFVHQLMETSEQPTLAVLQPFGQRLRRAIQTFFQSFDELWHKRQQLWPGIGRILLNEPLRLLALWLVLVGLNVQISLIVLMIVYTIGVLSMTLSITPQGLGATEAVMTGLFISFGVPAGLAALGVLLYRIITFWLPFGVGLILLRRPPAEAEA